MFKSYLLSELTKDKNNNCNLLRVIAALFVIISHSILFLSQSANFSHSNVNILYKLGFIGVNIFFILSGYLVSNSLINSQNLITYLANRFLRMWPGLVVNSLIIVFIIDITYNGFTNSFLFESSLNYLYSVLLLINPSYHGIPGVFNQHIYPEINGALWTISYECIMYCILAIMAILGILTPSKSAKVFCIGYLLFNVLVLNIYKYHLPNTVYEFLRFTILFNIGICFQLFQNKIKINSLVFMIAFAITCYLFSTGATSSVLFDISLGYSIFWLGFVPKWLLFYNKFGDYSYGLYIYGWPIGQALSSFIHTPFWLAVCTMLLSFCFAIVSWKLVESPALSLKNKVREISYIPVSQFKLHQRFIWVIVMLLLIIIFITPVLNAPEWHTLRYTPVY